MSLFLLAQPYSDRRSAGGFVFFKIFRVRRAVHLRQPPAASRDRSPSRCKARFLGVRGAPRRYHTPTRHRWRTRRSRRAVTGIAAHLLLCIGNNPRRRGLAHPDRHHGVPGDVIPPYHGKARHSTAAHAPIRRHARAPALHLLRSGYPRRMPTPHRRHRRQHVRQHRVSAHRVPVPFRRRLNGESAIFAQLRRRTESRAPALGIINPHAVRDSAIKKMHRTRMGEC